jgi:hypothetical protein
VFSLCRGVVIGTLTNALDAGRPPPSKEPPSGVSGSSTRWLSVPLTMLGGVAALFTELPRRGFSQKFETFRVLCIRTDTFAESSPRPPGYIAAQMQNFRG